MWKFGVVIVASSACVSVSVPGPVAIAVAPAPPPAVIAVAGGTDGPAPGTYVDLGTLGLGTSDFTISHWYSTSFDVAGTHGDVIGNRQAPSHGNFVSVRVHGDGTLAFEVDEDDRATHYTAVDSGTHRVNDGRWHHLAYTRRGRELAIFIDGAQVARAGSPAATPARLVDQTPFRIGRSLPPCCSNYQTVAGAYADVEVIPHALTADEIATVAHGS